MSCHVCAREIPYHTTPTPTWAYVFLGATATVAWKATKMEVDYTFVLLITVPYCSYTTSFAVAVSDFQLSAEGTYVI